MKRKRDLIPWTQPPIQNPPPPRLAGRQPAWEQFERPDTERPASWEPIRVDRQGRRIVRLPGGGETTLCALRAQQQREREAERRGR